MQLDRHAQKRGLNRSARTYHQAFTISHEVGEQLLERLEYLKCAPENILDIGAGDGHFTKQLSKRYPKAKVIGIDIAERRMQLAADSRGWFSKMQYLTADTTMLPFAANSFDLIVSNLCLYWASDVKLAAAEIARVLRPGGALLFSTFGPDTLQELRAYYASIDELSHVNVFLDMHDVGDALLSAGLKDPVMDVERIKKLYDSAQAIHTMQKQSGELNYSQTRPKSLYTKSRKLNEFPQQLSYEIIYGHAWGQEQLQQIDATSGEVRISIDKIIKR